MIRLFSLLFFMIAWFSPSVSAHLAGQLPFFKINGVYSSLYHVPVSSVADFDLPQDAAPTNYNEHQPLHLELDTNVLPFGPEITQKTSFFWDFGDGTRATGLINTHQYNQSGTYLLRIDAAYGTNQPGLLEIVAINILPRADYKLPTSVIQANGQAAQDPLVDVIKADFSRPILLDGLGSSGGDSTIKSYTWDFGDSQSAQGEKVTHQFDPGSSQRFIVMRVKNADGFWADSFAELAPVKLEMTKTPAPSFTPSVFPAYLTLALIGLLVGGVAISLYWIGQKKTPS